ncbi:hypothetical protein AVL48_00395 [Amycolatopsis regifaucium]|uniref:Uncharacterized protein n=1 Tax=Amycolatopsis regifaucium TaxID=546365 RepID=A0A154MW40_9PSEU|nr:hypothetical protein AVL48_00395 [Amycolatopsis regifaucium]OKA07252.1 hypothetical protein ATP06_0215395 [Amycolatopsis regifaucium]SFI52012.1 hypothetical protein SAMN04489731_11177 [Amycolatopsis regifaucium]
MGVLTGTLATVAHLSANGRVPDLGVVVLLVALLSWVAYAFAGRRRGPLAILCLVAGGQLGMHASLTFLAWESHSRHAETPDSGLLMTAGHAVATLVVVAVLAGAERALFVLLALIASVLPRRLGPRPATAPLRLHVPVAVQYPATGALLRDVLSRRGPPVSFA